MSLLQLQTTLEGDAAVVHCSGKLVAGNTQELQAAVKPLVQNYKRVVLDFTDLTYMDSMGVGSVVSSFVSARGSGCRLELVNFSQRVRDLLSITNVLSLFESAGEQSNRVL